MKCPECGGTNYVRMVMSYLWENEYYDTVTTTTAVEEVERDFQETQERWRCVDETCDMSLTEDAIAELDELYDEAKWGHR
jgi:hypothetical protein